MQVGYRFPARDARSGEATMQNPLRRLTAACAAVVVCAFALTATRPAHAAKCGSQWVKRGDPGSVLAAIEASQSAEEFECTTEAFVKALSRVLPPSQWAGAITLGDYRLQFAPADLANGIVAASDFDGFVPDQDVNIGSFRSQVVAEGAGVPFVGVVKATPRRRQAHPFMPPNGMVEPVTMIVEFADDPGGQGRLARLTMYDPSRTSLRLAANYTAPYAYLTGGRTKAVEAGELGMFDPQEDLKNTGLIVPTVYRNRRVPVVFVHGLDSQPLTWADTANELQADPEILANYSFWFFRYPTGYPVPFTAMLFRKQLKDAQVLYNSGGRNRDMDNMVVVGHSMGGLLSRVAVSDSGDALWSQHFDRPLEQIDAPPDTKQILADTMFFTHQSHVTRTVFISTPHRGSDLARGAIGSLGDKLIRASGALAGAAVDIVDLDPEAVNDHYRTMKIEAPTGIDNLKPDNKFLTAMDQMPIRVPYHTILGDRGKGDSPNSSDGVVPYWSSHMDGAQSEVIVDSGHSAHRNPVAVQELKRILRLHLQETGRARSTAARASRSR
jgi:pimeloyl-ACP methyl ester carboxylesterase